ncbi:serine hydrolase [Anaerosporobacter sp.]|uniref:serine hydrolase n=1 Tax=Anaerosporobacter sp. TaxID=1872529 RepID=UPI00286F05C1|nr:serine hydrolase [Anaerosporobacter sp.]
MDIQKRMRDYNVPGASITYFNEGKIQWNKGFGILEKDTLKSVDEHSVFHACSISKMITSLFLFSRLGSRNAMQITSLL